MKRKESGQATVEFALVLPIFVLLLFAVIEFGLFFIAAMRTENAAYEGARAASMYAGALDDGALRSLVENTVEDNLGDAPEVLNTTITFGVDSVRVEVSRSVRLPGMLIRSVTGGTYKAGYTAVLPPAENEAQEET